MMELENILNKAGDFQLPLHKTQISISGTLFRDESGRVLLHMRTPICHLNEIMSMNDFQICGTIEEVPITCLHAYFVESTPNMPYVSWKVEPSEILVGLSTLNSVEITKIAAIIHPLNNMFSILPVKLNHKSSKENPSLLQLTFPNDLIAEDDIGSIHVYQTLKRSWSQSSVSFCYDPIIECSFYEPTEIIDALHRLAAVRNLFSFFANYYLPIEDIRFIDNQKADNTEILPNNCAMYLNHREEISTSNMPFIIPSKVFGTNFSDIWQKWLTFYSDAIYIPTLFYEIICNRSTGINCFLNLAQSIEIYSTYYRNQYAKTIQRRYGDHHKNISLKYRLEDIFTAWNSSLELNESNIAPLAKVISGMRNFYTHYDKDETAPSYYKLSAANRLLRTVLLLIVYRVIGLDDVQLKESKKRMLFGNVEREEAILLGV